MEKLEEAVLKAVDEYNKYRSPEAKARLIKIWEGGLTLDFEGIFCQTCGVYDYLEDFIYELQRLVDVSIGILNFKEYEPGRIRVEYRLKRTYWHRKILKGKVLPNYSKTLTVFLGLSIHVNG